MTDPTAAFAAAVARHQAGDLAAAEQLYRELLAAQPDHAAARCNLGALLVRAGRLDEAAEQYRLALAASPDYADAHFNFGNLYRRTAQLAPAAEHYRACLAKNPSHAGARHNLGIVYVTTGNLAAAEECFRAVVRQEPANADAFARLGDVLVRTGQAGEGVAALKTAVTLAPGDPRTLYNYGLALSAAGRSDEAHYVLQHTLRLNPTYAEAYNALGLAFEALGRKDDALAHYRQAVELKPDLADAWSNLGTSLGEQGRADDAIEALRESLRRRSAPAVHSNLVLMTNYTSRLTPEQVRDEALGWANRFAGETPPAPPVPEPHDPDRRLRIGYISADFRKHTVAPFIETLLRHHDRTCVEVYAYANVLRPDETTERLNALADHWRPIAGVPDEQVARQIGDDRLDVLIDLSGHTAGNRLLVLARRPAPVQALLFGYPNTTGMRAVDYRVSDAVSDPEGMTEHLYAERPLRLPEVPWVYVPPADAPPVNELPSLGGGPFTLGCLNNAAKISDACLAAWAAVLRAVPDARLVLLAGQTRAGAEHLVERFAAAGVARERIEPVSRLPRGEYLAAYRRFDLTLDPFSYNGGVTTGDSLWMGTPVLTVAGSSYVSRQGAMAMTAVGLRECVAGSPEGLIEVVRTWANDRPRLAELRAGLRERVARSPLADGPRYVRHLEDALRRAWRERLP